MDWEPSDLPPRPCRNCGALVSPEVVEYEDDPNDLGPPLGSYARYPCKMCGDTTIVPLSAFASKEEVEDPEKEAEQAWPLEHEEHEDQSDE